MKRFFDKKDYKRMFFAAGIISLLILMILFNKAIFFVLLFVIANIILSLVLFPLRQILFGIDLTMLSSVLCSMAFGWKVGLLVAVLSSVSKLIAQQSFSIYGLVVVPSYIIIGIFSGFMGEMNIFYVGLIAVIFHALLTSILSFFLLGGNVAKIILFLITNVPLNIFIFYYFAAGLLGVMV